MKLKVYNTQGQETGEVEVSDKVFGAAVKPHLFWEVVRWQQAKRRAGTHAVKTRTQVSGTTAKMYKQKGTGRARHGSAKSPLFVGGGIAHGPKQRSYAYRVNKKVKAGAVRSALSQKVQQSKLMVLESFELSEIKTKQAAQVLRTLGVRRALVLDVNNEVLGLSLRNLVQDKYLPVEGLNVFDVLNHESVLLTKAALDEIQRRLA